MHLRNQILAFVFAILLLLPTVDQLFNLSTRFSSTENRQISGMPAVNFPHVRSFARQFDRYYKENFGWRNALFYAYSRWKFYWLDQSPLPEKVIVGKKGWFYLGNSYNNVMDQHRGLWPLSADSARIIANHLMVRQQELASQGIKLYVFIAPDSQTIYPENLPDHLHVSSKPSRLDILRQAMNKTSVPFIDIRDTLWAAKRSHVVYYQTDTHWNDYGMLIGCSALLNRIHRDLPTVPSIDLSDYKIEKQQGLGGDLTTMLTMQKECKDPIFYSIAPSAQVTGRQTEVVRDPKLDFPSTRFTGPGANRLLFIGDSFSHSMMQLLPGYFGESFFVRDSKLDRALLQAEHPDVVVIEIVERNLSKLAKF